MSVSAIHASRVLIKYRARRLFNFLATSFSRGKKQAKRTATPRKATGWFVAVYFSLYIVAFSGLAANENLETAFKVLGNTHVEDGMETHPAWKCDFDRGECSAIEIAPGRMMAQPVFRLIVLQVMLAFLAMLLLNVAAKELAAPEWDLEWLYTMPISFNALTGSRVLERTFVNPSGLLLLAPLLVVLCWRLDWGFWSLPVGMGIWVLLSMLGAVVRTLIDTGLRVTFAPSQLRNLQAVCSVLATIGMVFLLSAHAGETYLMPWSTRLPGWIEWTSFGLATRIIDSVGFVEPLFSSAALLVQIGTAYLVVLFVLQHLLAKGLVTGSGREGTLRKRIAGRTPECSDQQRWFSPVALKELRLLARDRNLMAQTVVVPALIIGMQFFTQDKSISDVLGGKFTVVAATAFGAAAYSMVTSILPLLNTEGQSIWLLYTFPRRIEDLLKDKLKLWLSLALIYPAVIFSASFFVSGVPEPEALALMPIVLLGIFIYGVVAVCFGVLACDPLAEDIRHRTRVDYIYLYMLLTGFYTYAIFAESYWTKLTLLIISSLMALALLQKVADRLPYLLDPTATPASRVSLSDGMIAAQIFFVTQAIVGLFLNRDGTSQAELLFPFSIAGFVAFTGVRFAYWKGGTLGVPVIFGSEWQKALGVGLLGGSIAAAAGTGYVWLMRQQGLLPVDTAPGQFSLLEGWWFPFLPLVAAPLFEEFIFRGLIFSGLRRSWGVWGGALGSAAVFAVVHPALAVAPVFVLGLLAAVAYSLSGLLLAPIIAHAVYNTVIVFWVN